MSLHPLRTRSYLCGALAGAFTTLAIVARREGSALSWLSGGLALLCGAWAVHLEERAQRR